MSKPRRIRRMKWRNLSMVKNPAIRTHFYVTKEEKAMESDVKVEQGGMDELKGAMECMRQVNDDLPEECQNAMKVIFAHLDKIVNAEKPAEKPKVEPPAEVPAAKSEADEQAAKAKAEADAKLKAESDAKAKFEAESREKQAKADMEARIEAEVTKRVDAKIDEIVDGIGKELGTLVEAAVQKRAG